ncbi:MAG: signal peptidase II [Acutalibacteraceae bacterium]
MIFWILGIAAAAAVLDQIFKELVLAYVVPVGSIEVIPSLFSLVYTENRGVAFGLFQNTTWLFAIVTVLIIAFLLFFYQKYKFKSKLIITAMGLVIGGGIGNLIDRIFRGYVIDFLSVSFFPPVCNFADYCVVVGAVILILTLFFGKSLETESNTLDNTHGEDHE